MDFSRLSLVDLIGVQGCVLVLIALAAIGAWLYMGLAWVAHHVRWI